MVNDNLIFQIEHLLDIEKKYYELIYQIARVYPRETRHDTALKYIKRAEEHSTGIASQGKFNV
jgi:hypothetical protein